MYIYINHKKHNHISNSIYKIKGREGFNNFIFMSFFFFGITKNNSNLKVIYVIYIP